MIFFGFFSSTELEQKHFKCVSLRFSLFMNKLYSKKYGSLKRKKGKLLGVYLVISLKTHYKSLTSLLKL